MNESIQLNERLIKLVTAMGYTQTKTRDLRYRKFSCPGKPHIWISKKAYSVLTGETLGKAIPLKDSLHRLFKRYSV
jgi:hypothetical protein